MKLLHCRSCEDVVALRVSDDHRHCDCGRSFGKLNSAKQPEIFGPAILLGIADNKLARAINAQPDSGKGPPFHAYVFPRSLSGAVSEAV